MKRSSIFVSVVVLFPLAMWAAVLGSVRGVVHDPDHRPVKGATVLVKSGTADYSQTTTTGADGDFEVTSIPVGAYQVTVRHDGFNASVQAAVVDSGSAPNGRRPRRRSTGDR